VNLFAIDHPVGITPGIRFEFKSPLQHLFHECLPEKKRCLESPIKDLAQRQRHNSFSIIHVHEVHITTTT